MREVSAVSVMGLMASLMSRSDIASILQGHSQTGKGLCKLIHGILESFARHKLGGVVGADLDFCAGLRVAACACLALDHLEVPESHQVDHRGLLLELALCCFRFLLIPDPISRV